MARMLRNNTVRLDGAEQVCVMLKSWSSGGWKRFIEQTQHQEDKERGQKLQAFEKKHNIKFRYTVNKGVYFIGVKSQ